MKLVKLCVLVLGLGWGLVGWGQPSGSVDPGEGYFQRGQFEKAVEYWEGRSKLIIEGQQLRNIKVLTVEQQLRLAEAYQQLGRLQKSFDILQHLLDQLNLKPVARAEVLMHLSEVYLAMGNLKYDKGCNTIQTDPLTWEKNMQKAQEYLEEADLILSAEKTPQAKLVSAVVLNNQGNWLLTQKEYVKALLNYHKSVQLAEQQNDKALIANVSINMVQAAFEILLAYRKNLCAFKQVAGRVLSANQVRVNLDKELKESRVTLKVEESMLQIKELIKVLANGKSEIAFPETTLKPVKELASLLGAEIKDRPQMIDLLQQVLKQLEKDDLMTTLQHDVQKMLRDKIEATWRQVQSTDSLGSHDKAFALMGLARLLQLSQALSTGQAQSCPVPSRFEIFKSLLKQPVAQSCSSPFSKEEDVLRFGILNKALEIAETPNTMAYATGYLAQFYAEKKCYQKAIQLTHQAISFAFAQRYPELKTEIQVELWGYPEQLYRWEWQLGTLLKEQGQAPLEEVLAAYERATQQLQLVRSRYRSFSQSFREEAEKFYLERADLLLQSAEREPAENKNATLRKVINSIESMNEAELQNYFLDDCVTEALKNRIKSEEAPLPSKIAVFYPLIFDDRVELLLTLKNPVNNSNLIKQIKTGISAKDMQQEAESFREKVKRNEYMRQRIKQGNDDEYNYSTHANRLYEGLITPIIPYLAGIETLVVVPQGILRSIPFSALCDNCSNDDESNGKQKKFLFQRYMLAIVPAWGLVDLRSTQHDNTVTKALLNGLTIPPKDLLGYSFVTLDSVPEGLSDIQNLLTGADRLEENGFTIPNLETRLKGYPPYSIVHFSTHGHFDEDKNLSFLVAYDGALTLDFLEYLLKGGVFLKSPVDLLTLSACQSAIGKEQRAALGLAGVSVKAGVRSAVGTLWLVAESSTRELMTNFYQHFVDNRDTDFYKARALQQAQLYLMEEKSYYDPYFWAAFLLVGNWQ